MAVVTPPPFLDVDSVYGADDLGVLYRDLIGEGVMGYEDLRVRQRGAGANMSVDVGSGTAWVMGDESLQQPRYRVYNDATVNVAVTAAHATNPRIDMVIAEVRDATFSGAFNDWRLRMVDGTATGGATLDNRTGAAALPNNSILLADVLVPALDTTVNDAEIRDRRPFGAPGVVPPLLTDVDMVSLMPHPALPLTRQADITHPGHDGHQAAYLAHLPRRIVSATRIRWRYVNAGAITGNYVMAIFDASGRKIVDTGSVAFTGAGATWQTRSETIAATTFEAGWYYFFLGIDSTGGIELYCHGVGMDTSAQVVAAPFPNLGVRSTTGGVTAPNTLLAMTDVSTVVTADANIPYVPVVSLSVG